MSKDNLYKQANLILVFTDDDPDGLFATVREIFTHGGIKYPVALFDRETDEELPNTNRVFSNYSSAVDFAKKATNQ